jgi:hypothetical protein
VWRVSYFVVVIVGRGNVAFQDFGSGFVIIDHVLNGVWKEEVC